MANGMRDLKGWHIATPEEVAAWERDAEIQEAEELKRWPLSQRRNRCFCGAFVSNSHRWLTKCKACGESWASQQ